MTPQAQTSVKLKGTANHIASRYAQNNSYSCWYDISRCIMRANTFSDLRHVSSVLTYPISLGMSGRSEGNSTLNDKNPPTCMQTALNPHSPMHQPNVPHDHQTQSQKNSTQFSSPQGLAKPDTRKSCIMCFLQYKHALFMMNTQLPYIELVKSKKLLNMLCCHVCIAFPRS